jgi:hypothetical protein
MCFVDVVIIFNIFSFCTIRTNQIPRKLYFIYKLYYSLAKYVMLFNLKFNIKTIKVTSLIHYINLYIMYTLLLNIFTSPISSYLTIEGRCLYVEIVFF